MHLHLHITILPNIVRLWSDRVYGIQPEQVAGQQHSDQVRTGRRQTRDRAALLEVNFIDDKVGKLAKAKAKAKGGHGRQETRMEQRICGLSVGLGTSIAVWIAV